MTQQTVMKDLIALVADGQMEFTLRGLLTRGRSLLFRQITADIYVHPGKDPGCLRRGHEFLRPFSRQYSHALVMHDREGCGREESSRQTLEAEMASRLNGSGWRNRCAAIVIDPELEVWVWSDSPEVAQVLGWGGHEPPLADWLKTRGHGDLGHEKPRHPKKAMEETLRTSGKRRSSAIFRQLAERVSVQRCQDPAFQKLKATLREWFPQ